MGLEVRHVEDQGLMSACPLSLNMLCATSVHLKPPEVFLVSVLGGQAQI